MKNQILWTREKSECPKLSFRPKGEILFIQIVTPARFLAALEMTTKRDFLQVHQVSSRHEQDRLASYFLGATMQQADIIIKNGPILTMDKKNTVIEDGLVCIKGDTISRMGSGDNIPVEAKKIIDAHGGLILPGLINGHTHAAMSLFRGLADDLPLMEWLNNYIFPAESRIDADFVFTGTLLACAEMIMSGRQHSVTCICLRKRRQGRPEKRK